MASEDIFIFIFFPLKSKISSPLLIFFMTLVVRKERLGRRGNCRGRRD